MPLFVTRFCTIFEIWSDEKKKISCPSGDSVDKYSERKCLLTNSN